MFDYAIVGGGRLARHFSEYFQLLEIPHVCWTRDAKSPFNSCAHENAGQRLRATVDQARRVLLLVSDDAIAGVLKQYPFLHEKQIIHCSGALSIPGVAGVHPLMTFADELYGLDRYRSIPFMCEAGHSFAELFPGLQNPHFSIAVEDKARYHAMCVMAGNFTQIMWQSISDRFEHQLNLPATTLQPYLQQLITNFISAPQTSLTGPLARNDQQTIARNIQSLQADPLQDLYQAFHRYYQSEQAKDISQETIQREQSA